MSPVSTTTAEPSRFTDGEGCQGWTKANPVKNGRGLNDALSGHHCGGVGGGGMLGRVVGIRDEISSGGRRRPTAGTSGEPARPVRPGEKSERFIVATKARNGAGAKGPHLVDVNSEARDRAMAPLGEIATTTKVRALQRTLCRNAKRATSIAVAVNDHGKPDAGKPPVRFDEGRGVPRGTDNYGRFNSHRELPAYSTKISFFLRIGIFTRNVLPHRGALSTSTVPWCASTIERTMLSPKPQPPRCRVRLWSTW